MVLLALSNSWNALNCFIKGFAVGLEANLIFAV
jgi:hypothetical protein